MKHAIKKRLKELVVEEEPKKEVSPETSRPKIPDFPNLVDLSSYELGEYFHAYTAYMAYVNQMLAEARFTNRHIKLRLGRLKCRALVEARGAFKAKQFAVVRSRVDIQALEDDLLAAQGISSGWSSIMWTVRGYMKAAEVEMLRRRSEPRD